VFKILKKKLKKDNIKLGLKENWKQFTILVIINAFVGAMVGMEDRYFKNLLKLNLEWLPKQLFYHL
jgi:hypothetical protein